MLSVVEWKFSLTEGFDVMSVLKHFTDAVLNLSSVPQEVGARVSILQIKKSGLREALYHPS